MRGLRSTTTATAARPAWARADRELRPRPVRQRLGPRTMTRGRHQLLVPAAPNRVVPSLPTYNVCLRSHDLPDSSARVLAVASVDVASSVRASCQCLVHRPNRSREAKVREARRTKSLAKTGCVLTTRTSSRGRKNAQCMKNPFFRGEVRPAETSDTGQGPALGGRAQQIHT